MPVSIHGGLDLDAPFRAHEYTNAATDKLFRDRAESRAARDYQRAETATPGSGRAAAAGALRNSGYLTESQEFESGEATLRGQDLNNRGQELSNQDNEVSLRHKQASGAANMLRAIRRIQDPEQRRAMGERFRGHFETMGVPREEIDEFDYTDESLDGLITQLEGAQDIESVEDINGMMIATRRDGSQQILGEAPMSDMHRQSAELELESDRAGLEYQRAQTAHYNRRPGTSGSGANSGVDRRLTPEEIQDEGLNPAEPWRYGRNGRPYLPAGTSTRPRGESAQRIAQFYPTLANAAVEMQEIYEDGEGNPMAGANAPGFSGSLANMARGVPFVGSRAAAVIGGERYDRFASRVAAVEGPVTNIIAGASQTEGEAERVRRLVVISPTDSDEMVRQKLVNVRMLANTFARLSGAPRPFPDENDLDIAGIQTEETRTGGDDGQGNYYDDDAGGDEDFGGVSTEDLIGRLP